MKSYAMKTLKLPTDLRRLQTNNGSSSYFLLLKRTAKRCKSATSLTMLKWVTLNYRLKNLQMEHLMDSLTRKMY